MKHFYIVPSHLRLRAGLLGMERVLLTDRETKAEENLEILFKHVNGSRVRLEHSLLTPKPCPFYSIQLYAYLEVV